MEIIFFLSFLIVLSALAMFFMPESPYFLISKGKDKEAMKALMWLRGSKNVTDEYEEMKISFREQEAVGSTGFGTLFSDRIYLEPFIVMLLLMFFQQFSGINAVLFYLKNVFISAHSDMDAGLSAFIIGVVQILATGLAVLIVDRFGRKPLLAISAFLMCLSIFALGVFFHLDENIETESDEETVSNLGWLPLVSLIVYIAAFSLGFGPLPWAMNAELFPVEAKATATPLITAFNWTCAFLVSKFQKNINDGINASGGYFLFGSICFLATIFVIFILPETKGKTNDDMKQYFMKKAGRLEPKVSGMNNPSYDEKA